MKKIITLRFLRGISASGKSTYSNKFLKNTPDWYRVNRDSIRFMLHSNGWSMDQYLENKVTEIEQESLKTILSSGRNVIWDNTFIRPKYLDFAFELQDYISRVGKYELKFDIVDFGDVPLETCIERDKNRTPSVGEDIIRKQYKSLQDSNTAFYERYAELLSYKFVQPTYKSSSIVNAVIFDIDGTLAINSENRSPYDWDLVELDTVNPVVHEQIKYHLLNGRRIILVSGRDSVCRTQTERWLEDNNVYYDCLFMRKQNDNRKDDVVKRELFFEHIHDKFNTLLVYDDRDRVVKMWRNLGIPCFQVNDGDF